MKYILIKLIFLLLFSSFAYSQGNDSLEIKLLNEDIFREYVKMDTIWEGSNYSEYISKGMFQFNTQKDITLWLDSLINQLGKGYINPNSPEYEELSIFQKAKIKLFGLTYSKLDTTNWHNDFEWRDKEYFEEKGIRIVLKIYKENNPDHFNVVLYLFDTNNDLLENEKILSKEKERIHRLIFEQKKTVFSAQKEDKTFTVGKSRYFSFWNSFYPINYDSTMRVIYYDSLINFDFSKIKAKCLIDKNGNVLKWKLTENEESDSNIDISTLDKYRPILKFPKLKIDSIETYISLFEFKNFIKDSLDRSIFLTNFDTSFVDTTHKLRALYDYDLGKYKNTRILNWGSDIEIFNKNKNNIWEKVYSVRTNTEEYYCLEWFDIYDVNQDGYNDLIVSSCPNMNGNTWSDLYLYIPEKDSFILKEEGVHLFGPHLEDTTLMVKKEYLISQYVGSWYMPNTTTVYKWNNYQLETQLIFGTELLFRNMMADDDPIYFVYKRIDNELKLLKQSNMNGSGKIESEYLEKNLLAPYLESSK